MKFFVVKIVDNNISKLWSLKHDVIYNVPVGIKGGNIEEFIRTCYDIDLCLRELI